MHCYYENRMSYIIPYINYDRRGFEKFKDEWFDDVGENFCIVARAFYDILRSVRPPGVMDR